MEGRSSVARYQQLLSICEEEDKPLYQEIQAPAEGSTSSLIPYGVRLVALKRLQGIEPSQAEARMVNTWVKQPQGRFLKTMFIQCNDRFYPDYNGEKKWTVEQSSL